MVTYSHDGLRDSLTQLAAPPYLYESLRREISRSMRKATGLSLLRFVLDGNESSIEEVLLHFADLLTKSFRYEDLVARMGESEFVVLVTGDQTVARGLSDRFYESWQAQGTHSVKASYSYATYVESESALEFLNRLDHEELIQQES
jgi:GGDEF domain-containing protein